MMADTIEDRLRDALGSAARTVPDTLPPVLVEGRLPSTMRSRKPARRPFRMSTWRWPIVAVATATALTLVVGVPTMLLRGDSGNESGWATSPSTIPAADPPQFFLSIEDAEEGNPNSLQRVVVRHARTGAFVDAVTDQGIFWSVAAAPDQRTFYVSTLERNGAGCLSEGRILRVVLRSNGEAAQVETVPGTVDAWAGYEDLAVSPDGERLAFVTRSWEDDGGCKSREGWASDEYYRSELRVVDLESDAQRAWVSEEAEISSPSWAPDSRRLVFVWDSRNYLASSYVRHAGEIRMLDTTRRDDIDESEHVTDDEVVEIPGLGKGRLRYASVTADGRHAFAMFVKAVEVESKGSSSQEITTHALVKVSLADGTITVLDDRLENKHIDRFVLDASRRHALVAPDYDSGAPLQSRWTVARYDRGELRWLDQAPRPYAYAW